MGYTKGKWKLDKQICTPAYNAQDVIIGGKTIARVFFNDHIKSYPEENNANLIASSPDMYEALKGIQAAIKINIEMNGIHFYEHWLPILDRVIQKAEGK